MKKHDATVVLKGAGTLVQSKAGLPGVCGGGNPAMASGGMGDVLTGIIAGLSAAIPVGRYGTSYEFGQTCAFLCSKQAGFIVGQNILHDGGQVSLTM